METGVSGETWKKLVPHPRVPDENLEGTSAVEFSSEERGAPA